MIRLDLERSYWPTIINNGSALRTKFAECASSTKPQLANGSNSHCNMVSHQAGTELTASMCFPFREWKTQFRDEIAGNPEGEPTQ
jgi:hypothetical protein